MALATQPSYGPRIAILTVMLAAIVGAGLNVDAILGTKSEEATGEEAAGEEAAGEEAAGEEAAGEEAEASPDAKATAEAQGVDFAMEKHIARIVLENATKALLNEAARDLPDLPDAWSPADLQVDEGYVEDEDEAEYYEELDQLNTVMKASPDKERAALAKLFEKPKATPPKARPKPPEPKTMKLAMRPNAALITKKSDKPKRSATRTTAKSSARPAKAAPQATSKEVPPTPEAAPPEAPAEAEAKADPGISPNATAKELVRHGRKLLLSGNPSGAEKVYRMALNKSGSSARARYGLAKALYQQNRVKDATGQLQRILNANKNHGSALLMMGSLLQEQGQSGKARTFYQRYLDTHPNGRRADEVRSILSRL